ncbi:putative membrane protein [Alteromonas macleodii]
MSPHQYILSMKLILDNDSVITIRTIYFVYFNCFIKSATISLNEKRN